MSAPFRSYLLPLLVLVSLAAFLVPWWLGPGGPGSDSNIPPDPFAQRVDARRGLDALPRAEEPAGLDTLLQQFAPQQGPAAQAPLPTVRLWLVRLGPFQERPAAEEARRRLVESGVEAAVEPDYDAGPWWVETGPATEESAARALLRQARQATGAEGRVVALP